MTGMTTWQGQNSVQGSVRIAQIKGSCDGQGDGHSRPRKGESGRQHKTIGVVGLTAWQGSGVADDMMDGWARAGRRVRQSAEESGWEMSVQGGMWERIMCDAADGRTRQGKARQCRTGQGREGRGAGRERIAQDSAGQAGQKGLFRAG